MKFSNETLMEGIQSPVLETYELESQEESQAYASSWNSQLIEFSLRALKLDVFQLHII